MGERLEQVVRERVAKFGYCISGNTVFDRETGLVLHEAEDAEWAYDWAVDQMMCGHDAARHVCVVRLEALR